MAHSYYSKQISEFLLENKLHILGELSSNNIFGLDDTQRDAWLKQVDVLKRELQPFRDGWILFEYSIPRVGKRVDNILIINGLVFVVEFKAGENTYPAYAINQVVDYALDLKNFQKQSHDKLLVPILVATAAPGVIPEVQIDEDGVFKSIRCNEHNLGSILKRICQEYSKASIDALTWQNSVYMPTPTIIEAAQALYRGHHVEEISRNDAHAINLNITTEEINSIIEQTKQNKEKAICFITGVPGSGKTLAGLNIANIRHNFDEDDHAVFLSGNGPLVAVLQEALARDEYEYSGHAIKKSEALRKTRAFIQLIHHFRDEALNDEKQPPHDKIAIFDEAQRAWTLEQTSKFMLTKKGKPGFNKSEPEFLIEYMDRHKDWAVIICLVGGGQEINVGEAGLSEWFNALRKRFPNWMVYLSNKITDSEYVGDKQLEELLKGTHYEYCTNLHLAVSLRSFRSEKVSDFVKALLDVEVDRAKSLYQSLIDVYPIYLTRNLESAKSWIKKQARGNERYGLIASSNAQRLRPFGIWVQHKVDAVTWFLNDMEDIRSSYFLEEIATEFDIQGLELDWTIVGWDANYRFYNGEFHAYNFSGTKWNHIRKQESRLYLKNSYRVLLTRARQGLIIFLPEGDELDDTRLPEFYDGIYRYLKTIGIRELTA